MRTAEQIVRDKDRRLIAVSPDATIAEALRLMIDNQIGAMLIKESDQIVGIWTERDLLRNTMTAGFYPETARIGDYMSRGLPSAPHDDSCFQLLDKFLGLRRRHLLIKKDDQYLGLLSIGDVIKSCLQAKDEELRKLNAFVSWEYYENWRWRKK